MKRSKLLLFVGVFGFVSFASAMNITTGKEFSSDRDQKTGKLLRENKKAVATSEIVGSGGQSIKAYGSEKEKGKQPSNLGEAEVTSEVVVGGQSVKAYGSGK